MATERFREQHKKLLDKAQAVSTSLAMDTPSGVKQAVMRMAELIGELKSHLLFEDKFLYPQLASSKHPRLAELSQEYQQQMGDLSESVSAYWEKWNSPTVAEANRETFVRETRSLLEALKSRIAREDAQLYALADTALGKTVI